MLVGGVDPFVSVTLFARSWPNGAGERHGLKTNLYKIKKMITTARENGGGTLMRRNRTKPTKQKQIKYDNICCASVESKHIQKGEKNNK